MKNNPLPKFQAFFPSTEVKNLDINRDKNYIINSLLINSNQQGWKWMLETYSKEEISEVVKESRNLQPRDVYFWMNLYNIPKEEIKCLHKNSQKTQKTYWM